MLLIQFHVLVVSAIHCEPHWLYVAYLLNTHDWSNTQQVSRETSVFFIAYILNKCSEVITWSIKGKQGM